MRLYPITDLEGREYNNNILKAFGFEVFYFLFGILMGKKRSSVS